jgi:hypothetical protein
MLSSQQALFPNFQLLLLLPSADLFQLYLTSPVLVINSLEVFKDLLHRVSHSIGFYRRFCFFGFSSFLPVFGFISLLCSGTHLVQCGASSWTHGWGVFSLSRDPRV